MIRRRQRAPWSMLVAILATGLGASRVDAQGSMPRQVAAPASDILAGVVRLPDPASTPTVSRAAWIPLRFEREASGAWTADLEVPIERSGPLALAILSPDAGNLRLLVRDGGGSARPIGDAFVLERRTQLVGEELPGWIVDRYDVRDAPAGAWRLRIETAPGAMRAPEESWLLASADPGLRVEAYTTTQQLLAGESIGIVARMRSDARAARVENARVVLTNGGLTTELLMRDDGLHEDGAAGDGLFGALVPESIRGHVLARVEIAGSIGAESAGIGARSRFLRSAQLAFPVLDRTLALDGPARADAVDEDHLEISIPALALGPVRRLHVSAEVWGRDRDGRLVPVCWLSRQLDPQARGDTWTLPLTLDGRWLAFAHVDSELELREVRVQDPDTEVVLDRAARMRLAIGALPAAASRPTSSITAAMLTGNASTTLSTVPPPAAPPAGSSALVVTHPALMLVHGYCSGGSIWPAADFTQPKLEFLDPNQNRTHDQFAQLIAQQAQAAGLTSFGVVAHSQGGPAALHLLTYYTSGLDLCNRQRRIQSASSPYQGTPLASLGAFACGVNNDMTLAGAATWLAGIPTWARSEVWFYTVSDGGSNCNALTSLFLTNPEDGTVEKIHCDLPGAHSMGHTTGWCHTTGMSYPAVYTDHARNAVMNSQGAR
jgi:hypothetical protein